MPALWWAPMTPTPIRDYDGLITALKARADEIGVTTQFLDYLTGLPQGYVGKVMGPSRVRRIGFDSIFDLAEAVAMRLELVPDLEAAKRMEKRWEARDEQRRRPGVIRKTFSPEVRAKVMSEIGRIGGTKPKRFRLSKKQRSIIARRNGKKGGRPRRADPKASGALPPKAAPALSGHAVSPAPRSQRKVVLDQAEAR